MVTGVRGQEGGGEAVEGARGSLCWWIQEPTRVIKFIELNILIGQVGM